MFDDDGGDDDDGDMMVMIMMKTTTTMMMVMMMMVMSTMFWPEAKNVHLIKTQQKVNYCFKKKLRTKSGGTFFFFKSMNFELSNFLQRKSDLNGKAECYGKKTSRCVSYEP